MQTRPPASEVAALAAMGACQEELEARGIDFWSFEVGALSEQQKGGDDGYRTISVAFLAELAQLVDLVDEDQDPSVSNAMDRISKLIG